MTTGESALAAERRHRTRWKQDPEGVKADIIAVALEEFARNGLSGARMDEIAAKTRTSKRMIYYYFGDKEGLYRKALEEAYREVRAGEEELEARPLGSRSRRYVGWWSSPSTTTAVIRTSFAW